MVWPDAMARARSPYGSSESTNRCRGTCWNARSSSPSRSPRRSSWSCTIRARANAHSASDTPTGGPAPSAAALRSGAITPWGRPGARVAIRDPRGHHRRHLMRRPLGASDAQRSWFAGRHAWTGLFAPDDSARGVGARRVALARRRSASWRAIGAGARLRPAKRRGVEQLVEEAVGALTEEPARLDSAARCEKHAHGQPYEEEPDRDSNAAEHGFASDVRQDGQDSRRSGARPMPRAWSTPAPACWVLAW